MLKAALFDLDGVVIDTEGQYDLFWNRIGQVYLDYGPNFVRNIRGTTIVQTMERWFAHDADLAATVLRELRDFERQMTFQYIAGAEAFILDLRRDGVKTAIVTSSDERKLSHVLAAHPEFRERFDAILKAEDFAHSKPDPDCYLRAAERLGMAPSDCVVFEDSLAGLQAGRAAGMPVVGLATTLPMSEVAPRSDIQLRDFRGATLTAIEACLFPFG